LWRDISSCMGSSITQSWGQTIGGGSSGEIHAAEINRMGQKQ
jgi:hypothetical protein